MAQLVLLNLGEGQVETGFPLVTLQLCRESLTGRLEVISSITGALPPAPELANIHHRWQLLYELIYRVRSVQIRGVTVTDSDSSSSTGSKDDEGIEINESDITHVSDQDFSDICILLKQQLNAWLDSANFRTIERQLRMRLTPNQDIRLIIQTSDPFLRQLPWCIWQFFDDYPRAEVAMSALNYDSLPSAPSRSSKVRILAILGNSTGIDLTADEAILQALPGAEVVFLSEPTRKDFNDALWQADGWDILFFAGHSVNQVTTGAMQINASEWLTVEQLRHGLNHAINQGLQFAIFNSCDGLGLAAQLADLNIPQMVVMREPVPDQVAQEFLKYFLTFFAKGTPFNQAVRTARERLQGLEGDFPGASWLPVIFQNPSSIPKHWSQLPHFSPFIPSGFPGAPFFPYPTSSRPYRHEPARPAIPVAKWFVVFLPLAITALIMGIRWLGWLQPLELSMWDRLLRMRPPEPWDDRIVLVTIDNEDITFQKQRYSMQPEEGSLSDQALVELLQTIVPYQPAIVGLDIYRDLQTRVDPDAAGQVDQFRTPKSSSENNAGISSPVFIDICLIGGEKTEVSAPPNAHPDQVGFSDIPIDPQDGVIRRQIFGMSPGHSEGCSTSRSLSFRVAEHYLARHGIEIQRPSSSQNQIIVNDRTFTKVTRHSGGYHNIDDRGFTVMLNYRTIQTVKPVSLQSILDGPKPDEWETLLEDSIVLIGNISKIGGNYLDYHQTPYSMPNSREENPPGVEIQAQMISQMISAGINHRAVVWWWPQWGDMLWVGLWALVSGGVGEWVQQTPRRYRIYYGAIAVGTLLVALGESCFVILWQTGGWLPLVPSAIATILAAPTTYMIGRQSPKDVNLQNR